jgi:hypothetical protein
MKGYAEYELALLAGDSPLSDRHRITWKTPSRTEP